MTRRTLKTTTASLLMISLIQPFPAMAQVRALNVNTAQQSSGNTAEARIILAQSAAPTCFTNAEIDTARCDIEMLRAELETLLTDGLPAPEDRAPEDDLTAALTADERIGLLSAAIEDAEREASVEAEALQVEADAAAEAEATQAEADAAAEAEATQAEADAAAEAEALQVEADAAAEAEAAQAEADATAEAEATQAEADAAAEAEATQAEADAAAEAEATQAEADAAAEAEATQAEADAAAEAEATQAEADATAEAEATQAEADAAAEAEATQAEADAAAEAEATQAEADATAEAEATQAEADAAAEAEATQAEANAAAEAEATQAEANAAAEAEATQAEADATAEAEADAAAEAEAEADAAAEAEAEAAEAAQVEAEAAVNEAEASAQKDAEIIAAQEEAQNLAAVTAATEAATEAATAEAEAAAEADTTTEVVVEGEARSSDQEFTTQATNRADTTAEASASDRDRGLSALEKGGLLALGALAVGAIMSNGQRVAATSGDRVIVEDNSGRFQVLKDDDAVLRQPGSTVQTRRFDDGSTTSTVTREDGSRVVTIRDASGRVLRRSVFDTSGRESLLIDDIRRVEPVNVSTLPPIQPRRAEIGGRTDRDALRAALRAAEARDLGRTFSLRQVRDIVEVRELAAEIGLEDVTFRTGSAAIQPSEAEQLREIGLLMRELIRENPREVFLVEGYTDAIGNAAFNLLLSDRRAESVALALTEYFDVPPENMVVQGYGERFLKIPTLEAERLNRRVSVRRITNLIAQR